MSFRRLVRPNALLGSLFQEVWDSTDSQVCNAYAIQLASVCCVLYKAVHEVLANARLAILKLAR